MKPKILIFSLAYLPFVGGAELALKEITDRLPQYDFHLITHRFDRAWDREQRIGNARVYRVGMGYGSYYKQRLGKFLFIPLAFWKGFRLHQKYRYRLVWSLMASRASGPAFLMKVLYPRIPFLLTIQEGDTPEYARARAGIFRIFWKQIFRMANHIQVISAYLKGWCIAEGAKPERISIIPNGIDEKIFSGEISESEKSNLRAALGILAKEKVVITTSRLVPKNGVDVLIDACANVLREFPDTRLLVVGSGPEQKNLELRIQNLELNHTVKFVGVVPNAELPKYLAISDIFVRPSRSEGLGTSFLEAMAMGVPIIGTPVGGIPDFLTDGVTGLFAKPEDAKDCARQIKRLLTDSGLRSEIIHNASALIRQKYQWSDIALEFQRLLEGIFQTARKKKILLVSGIFPPDIGGSATYSSALLRELPRHEIDLRVLTYGTPLPSDENNGISRISRKWIKGLRHIVFFLACLWQARGASAILSADASMGGGLLAAIAAFIMRKRFVVRVTGEYAWEQGRTRFGVSDSLDDFQNRHYHPVVEILRWLEHWLVKRADTVIAPSEYLKSIVIRWGVSKERIQVVYNAVSVSSAIVTERARSKTEVRRELGIAENIPMLISVGRLVPWKGFKGLIETMPLILKEFPRARLFIVGDGPEEEHLKSQILNLKLKDSVKLLGKMEQKKVFLYLRAADVFVLNTGYEGFSHQLIEALAVGTPVVTTRVGGNAEIIEDGISGRLVLYDSKEALAEAVVEVLKDEELKKQFIEHGLKRALGFTVERMLKAVLNIL